ncbi:MFS transporter [Breznakiella homolactica]|uniref:MFS transporter n=1 Tax=Breznakiella homolactica TaxID=2798577 RepID=A0A7T7XM07_9SPIR|nr:MFS transporter [Breznakiella homolactica]QQO08849.1 MFS transporter [Breznakiella homolactica]
MHTKINQSHWKKRIAYFLASQNISLFGSSVVGFAIIWHITLETSSGFWMMLSTICSLVPQVLISLFGGVWADRHNRKYLIMLADAFIALATLALAISFLLGFRRLELLLMASVVRSAGAGIQTPAVSAIFPQLVPEEKLTQIQGINQTLGSVLMLLSPAVGGLLLGTVGIVGAFFVDVVTAALAILVMSRISVEKVERVNPETSVWEDLKGGLRYTFGHRQLRNITICYIFSFFLITPAMALTPLMVERSFGSEVWRLTANEMVWTVGSLLGGAYVALKGQFRNKVRTAAVCLIAFGILFGLLGVSWNFTVYLVIMGLAGCFMPVLSTTQTVFIQEITEADVLGRVFSVIQLFSSSAMPAAILLFGPLADLVSVESIMLVCGGLLALVGLVYGFSERQPNKPVS